METDDNKSEDLRNAQRENLKENLHDVHREHLKQVFDNVHHHSTSGRVMGGLIVLGIGVVLLLKELGTIILPDWVFTWPVVLILVGLYVGARHNFHVGGWPIMIIIGGAFLAQNFYPHFNVSEYIWPVVIIGVGALMILPRRRRPGNWAHKQYWKNYRWQAKAHQQHWHGHGAHQRHWHGHGGQDTNPDTSSPEDVIDSVSFFGGVHKVVTSKEFKGGDVVNIFGGCEIDLTQADIKGKVNLSIVQIMGGAKIIVPSDWEIQSKMVAVFGGIEDKRNPAIIKNNPEKILVIDGTSIFAGVEILSY